MSSRYSIKDLERITGIKAHTLRIWEQRFSILNPLRTDTNIRYYNDADLKRILNISLLNNKGHKISNIARLSDDLLLKEVDKILHLYQKESDQIENLVLSLMDMDEEKFEAIITNCFLNFGFENTIEKIIFPFLRHLGNLWQVGIVSPAQEHYISNLIRQKQIVAIDQLPRKVKSGAATYLFFLPDSELHELGLLYTYYLARIKGHKCVYLGQSVPFEDLLNITKSVKPDYLVSIFTGDIPDIGANTYLKNCHEKILEVKFLFSGRLLLQSPEKISMPSQRFTLFEDFPDFKSFV